MRCQRSSSACRVARDESRRHKRRTQQHLSPTAPGCRGLCARDYCKVAPTRTHKHTHTHTHNARRARWCGCVADTSGRHSSIYPRPLPGAGDCALVTAARSRQHAHTHTHTHTHILLQQALQRARWCVADTSGEHSSIYPRPLPGAGDCALVVTARSRQHTPSCAGPPVKECEARRNSDLPGMKRYQTAHKQLDEDIDTCHERVLYSMATFDVVDRCALALKEQQHAQNRDVSSIKV